MGELRTENRVIRRSGSLGFACIGAAFVWCLPVQAAVAAPAPPVLEFLDDSTLTVDFDRLAAERGRLRVPVRNNHPTEEQVIEVRVVGLVGLSGTRDPALEAFSVSLPVTRNVPAGKVRRFDLKFQTERRPKPGSYEATVVALGSLGEIARRALKLDVKDPQPVVAPTEEALLLPATITDFSIAGVNFVPSFFGPVWPGLLAIASLILVLSWWTRAQSGWPHSLARPLLVAGVALLVTSLGAVLFFFPEPGSPTLSAIRLEQPEIASSATTGRIGSVLAADGDGSTVSNTDHRLEVADLERAGKYSGKIDLLAGKEGGDAVLTVNVRDWWPFAFLPLLLGVYVGYLITRYFKRERDVARRSIEIDRLWLEIGESESVFQQAFGGRLAHVSMKERAAVRLGDVRRLLLEDGDAAEAKKLLAALETYHEQFDEVRAALGRLADALDDAVRAIEEDGFGLEPDEVPMVGAGRRALDTTFDSSQPDTDDAELKKFTKLAEDALQWILDTFKQNHRVLAANLDFARDLDPKTWPDEAKIKLGGLRPKLGVESTSFLAAEAMDTMAKAAVAAKVTSVGIMELAAANSVVPDRVGTERMLTADYFHAPDDDRLQNLIEAFGGLTRDPREPLQATLECRVLRPGGASAECRGELDDLFAFTALVPSTSARGPSLRVRWVFGDGHSAPYFPLAIGERPTTVLTSHRFEKAGRWEVRLESLRGDELGRTEVHVTGTSHRAEVGRANLRLTDRNMTLASGFLATASGLVALYFASDTWGAPQDYLSAFLWGSVVSEGAKFATALASRVWPAG